MLDLRSKYEGGHKLDGNKDQASKIHFIQLEVEEGGLEDKDAEEGERN